MDSMAQAGKDGEEQQHQLPEEQEAANEEEEQEEEQEEEAVEEEEQEEDVEEEAREEANKEGNESHPPPSKPSIEGASPGKIFVGGLPKETTTATFTKYFGKYGEITDSVIMKDRMTGHPRGFGFVTFADPSAVDKVILEANLVDGKHTHMIDGKQVEIKRTIPKGAISGKDFKTKKIFVGGIPTTVTEDEFKNFFAKFGEVREHQIMRDHSTSRSRGFGFVTFGTEQSVDELLTKGNRIDFAGVQVEIKKAEPKKVSSAPALPPKHFSNPRPAFGRGFEDSYGAFQGGGISGRGYGTRPRAYGGHGGSEFDVGYGGYGSTGIGSYRSESSLGYSARYGGGLARGYELGVYDGANEGYGRYSGAYGSGYESGLGGGYGGVGGYAGSGAGLYGNRRDYGGSAGGRYHPYSR